MKRGPRGSEVRREEAGEIREKVMLLIAMMQSRVWSEEEGCHVEASFGGTNEEVLVVCFWAQVRDRTAVVSVSASHISRSLRA